jgi:hypothetical protein
MESIEQPAVLAMPFANNGTKNTIPSAATGTGAASLTEGFPLLTSTSITDNGIPPSRADMNGLGYVSTAYAYLMQCGGVYTYRNDVASAIGGYPLNALLWYIPTNGIPNLLRSTVVNNTNNFNEDSSVIGEEGSGKPWEIVTVTPTNFVTTNTAQTISGAKTFSSSPLVPTATTGDSSTKAASTEFVTGVETSLQTQINTKSTPAQITSAINTMLATLFPVGSIYIGTQSTCPLASLISGSQWQLVAQDRALWGGNGSNANSNISAGLPNITGAYNVQCLMNWGDLYERGAMYRGNVDNSQRPQNAGGTSGGNDLTLAINAARSSSIYGASSTVQPPAYRVNVWRRTA